MFDKLQEVEAHVLKHQPEIAHFGKQIDVSTQQGIEYINMLSLVRIADALEKIAARASGAGNSGDGALG